MATTANNIKKKLKKIKDLGIVGEFGRKWLVESMQSGNYYVMKKMKSGCCDKKKKEQTMDEFHKLFSCRHINITRGVSAYYVNKDKVDERILILTEYWNKGDLGQMISEQKNYLPEEEIIKILIGIINAIHYPQERLDSWKLEARQNFHV